MNVKDKLLKYSREATQFNAQTMPTIPLCSIIDIVCYSFAKTETVIMFAKENGRLQLLDRMRRMLPVGQEFTLAQAVDVFEKSFANDRIEDTTDGLMLVAWPIGSLGKRCFDIALCRSLGWEDVEWDEPPGQIIAHIKVPCGLPSLFLTKQMLQLEPSQHEDASSFFTSIRNTRMYRWYGLRKTIESKLTLWGGEEFFDMAATLLPKLKEAGLLNCDGSCTVAQSTDIGEKSDAREPSSQSAPKSTSTPRSP